MDLIQYYVHKIPELKIRLVYVCMYLYLHIYIHVYNKDIENNYIWKSYSKKPTLPQTIITTVTYLKRKFTTTAISKQKPNKHDIKVKTYSVVRKIS